MDKKTIGIVAALVLLVGGGVWYANRATPPAAPPPQRAEAPSGDTPPPPPSMPSTEDADARARTLVAGLSPRPEVAAWAQEKDLVRRFVALVDNVAEGKSPRAHVPFLSPKMPFSPDSTERWNTFGDVVATVDAQKFAAAYRELKPVIDAAYREVGAPGTTFEGRLKEAFARVENTPLPTSMPELKPAVGALYVYADPKLESLKPVEKQLLRMGPRNEKLVQTKARELRAALGL